ncbi:hypothetical protein CUMW_244930 [Citrus unshiu]|nr:hypothetical protein CUMW_244930 [Citrus unshiu]
MKINFGIIKTKYQKASVCPYLQVNLKKKKVNCWV